MTTEALAYNYKGEYVARFSVTPGRALDLYILLLCVTMDRLSAFERSI